MFVQRLSADFDVDHERRQGDAYLDPKHPVKTSCAQSSWSRRDPEM